MTAARRLSLDEMQKLAVLADGLAEHDGAPPVERPDQEAVSARVGALVADLVEPARSTALDKLDEGHQALLIATGWVRTKRQAQSAVRDAAVSSAEATL